MVLTSLDGLSGSQKEDLVASLSGLIVGTTDEVTAEKLQAVATASGNSIGAPMAALFAKVLTSAEKGVESYTPGPGGGGGGGGGGDAAGGDAAEAVKEEEEEEEAPIGGGDMFGGDDGGGGGDY